MAQTSRYALPLLEAGQAQKEVTHNDAVARIDALLHLVVESRRVAAPPPAPVDGSAWLVAASATGPWAGQDGNLALFDEAGWTFVAPRDGCMAFVRDEGVFIHRSGGSWRDAWPVAALAIDGRPVLSAGATAVPPPTGGATIDAEARTTIGQLLAVLRQAGLLSAT